MESQKDSPDQSPKDSQIVWAGTDEGIRGFLVPRGTKGFTTQDIHRKLSLRASITSELLLQAGDVIVQVNRTPVASAEDASRALDYYAGRGPIRLFFEREGQISYTDFVIR